MKKTLTFILTLSFVILSSCGDVEEPAAIKVNDSPALTETAPESETSAAANSEMTEFSEVSETSEDSGKQDSESADSENSITVFYDGNADDDMDIYAPQNKSGDPEFERSWTIDDAETVEAVRNWLSDFEKTHETAGEPLGLEIDGKQVLLNHYLETAVVIGDKYYTNCYYDETAELRDLLSEAPDSISVSHGNMKNMQRWSVKDPEKVAYIINKIAEIENTYPKQPGAWVCGGPMVISYNYNNTPYDVQVLNDGREDNLVVVTNMNEKLLKRSNTYCIEQDVIEELAELIYSENES